MTSIHAAIVRRAIELIEQGWTQFSMARDANGRRVLPPYNDAASFCASGAIARATYEVHGYGPKLSSTTDALTDRWAVFNHIRTYIGTNTVASWNDDRTRTKEDVLKVFETVLSDLVKEQGHEK